MLLLCCDYFLIRFGCPLLSLFLWYGKACFCILYKWCDLTCFSKGGVEDTRLEAKDRPSRGQGQGPRTQTQVFSKKRSSKFFFRRSQKKEGFKFFFLAKKVFKNFFSGDLYLRKPKKRSLQSFPKVSGVFQRNFKGSKICCPRAVDRAIFEDLRVRGQGQGLQNVSSRTSSRPRTSSRTPSLAIRSLICSIQFILRSNRLQYSLCQPWFFCYLVLSCRKLYFWKKFVG